MDRVHAAPPDEDEEYQSIQLLSFCERHRPKSNEQLTSEKRNGEKKATEDKHVEYIPPVNPSGCARTGIVISTIAFLDLIKCILFVSISDIQHWIKSEALVRQLLPCFLQNSIQFAFDKIIKSAHLFLHFL